MLLSSTPYFSSQTRPLAAFSRRRFGPVLSKLDRDVDESGAPVLAEVEDIWRRCLTANVHKFQNTGMKYQQNIKIQDAAKISSITEIAAF